jgi:uncharacterized membrane protein YdjX (TVP38/TMEM64 family)
MWEHKMKRKWLILLGYSIILIVGLINKDLILFWIQKSEPGKLPIMFFFSTLIASIPIIPFTLFAGLMGAKYGVTIGLLINWFGGVSAAIIYFYLSRYFFKDFFSNYLKGIKGIQKFQTRLEKNAMITILFSRMIAIIPSPVINIYSGISNIPFSNFFTATAIGMLPPMFILAFSGKQIFSSLHNLSLGIIFYLVFLLFILSIYKIWFIRQSKFN